MPGRDGVGPWGLGPRTGRGAGYCSGFGGSRFANPLRIRFAGRGRGVRGDRLDDQALLSEEADRLRRRLKAVEARIKQAESKEE